MIDKNKKNKIFQAVNFIEELAWLLDRKKNISLQEIANMLREESSIYENIINISYSTTLKSNNKDYLVGILPSLFMDEELFKSIDDLLDFAESVLHLSISRASKRSRIEYIGWIVCETTKLNNSQLSELVRNLGIIMASDVKLKQIKEAKKQPNFSWNETIAKIGKL